MQDISAGDGSCRVKKARPAFILRVLAPAAVLFSSLLAPFSGCGFDRIQPLLPDALGITFEELEMIQNDTSLTDDEKRDMIREAIGAPETEEGDRLVNFLLTFNVP